MQILDSSYEDYLGVGSTRDTQIQIALSVVLGIGAFIAFCVSPTPAGADACLKRV